MAAVAVFQFPAGDMQDPVKNSDKHPGIVVPAEFIVQLG